MKALLWKEWREQRWRLAFGCVLLIGFTLIGLQTRMTHDDAIVILVMLLGGFFIPLLVAVGTVGTDREEGSLAFVTALPVTSVRVLAAKTIMAILTIAVPVIGSFGLALIMAGGREMSAGKILGMGGETLWVAINLLIWTVALGANQPGESRVGAVGIGVVAAYISHAAFVDTFWKDHAEQLLLLPNPSRFFWQIETDAFLRNHANALFRYDVAAIVLQTAIMAALWYWAASRLVGTRRAVA